MKFMKKELYVFLYGKLTAETIMKKRQSLKKVLSPLIVILPILGYAIGVKLTGCVGMVILTWGLIWPVPEMLLVQKSKERKMEYKLGIPDFIDVVALILEAGQPLWYAVECASGMGESLICKRMRQIFAKNIGMDVNGNPEILLQLLAEELKIPAVSAVVSSIVQNSKKGEKELASVLRLQSNLCRQERKAMAEEMGNRVSNLLLIPSAMVFLAILLMLFAPAMMMLNVV
ncbi:MAG: hypothetical protein E7388_08085 [Ruminococcaceae bacterium]|nr:hypothetical protein [Oscillospiraceae bacterium]